MLQAASAGTHAMLSPHQATHEVLVNTTVVQRCLYATQRHCGFGLPRRWLELAWTIRISSMHTYAILSSC
jgi:hypothetical protein